MEHKLLQILAVALPKAISSSSLSKQQKQLINKQVIKAHKFFFFFDRIKHIILHFQKQEFHLQDRNASAQMVEGQQSWKLHSNDIWNPSHQTVICYHDYLSFVSNLKLINKKCKYTYKKRYINDENFLKWNSIRRLSAPSTEETTTYQFW